MQKELPTGYLLRSQYKIKRVIGRGGFGFVYLANDTFINKDVAVKEYFPSDFAQRDENHLGSVDI